MTVLRDYSRRFYLEVKRAHGMLYLLEKLDEGPSELHRAKGEEEMIGVRHVPEKSVVKYEKGEERKVYGAEDLFTAMPDISGGYLLRTWIESGYWQATPEAQEIMSKVIYIEDSVEWARHVAATRDPKEALAEARKLREESEAEKDAPFAFSKPLARIEHKVFQFSKKPVDKPASKPFQFSRRVR
jgi:hypothetical protein